MPTFYALHLRKEQFAGTLRLNDVPLSEWRDPKPAASAHAANLWISGRSNRVRVVFAWPREAAALQPSLEISVMETTRPDQPSDRGARVASFHWPPDPASPERPPEVSFAFEAADPPPSELWPAVTPLNLDAQTRAGARAALAELHGALARRDLERVAAILDFKAVDVGRAMYIDPGRARESHRDFLDIFLGEADFAMEPLDPAPIEFQLVADRRLVWASRPDGAPVLRSLASKNPQLLLPVYLAPLRGRWTVVR